MVRNKSGGSGHKKMASKHVKSNNFRSKKIRKAEKDELYAKVIRINGGSVFDILCNDKVVRQMVVRKKFRGRNKRDNALSMDTMVLVGIRTWQVLNTKKKEKVDLLEVYSKDQMEDLKKLKELNNEILPESVIEEDGIFDRSGIDDKELEDELNKKIENKKLENIKEEKDLEFNWDDI